MNNQTKEKEAELPYSLRMLIRDNTASAEKEVKIIEAVEAYVETILASKVKKPSKGMLNPKNNQS